NTTIKVASTNTNVSEGQRRSRGRGFSLQARPLMLPQEINELPYKEELVFIQPTKNNPTMNMRVEKIFWYKEPIFKERVDEKKYPLPDIPEGDTSKIEGLVVPVRPPVKKNVSISSPEGDDLNAEQKRRIMAPGVESEQDVYEDE
ncbi:type IV secretory system conjugative DNA transfer family protein, partial [Salmonella enterica subsp. enterica serovar Cerro]|nr:type IV secretory system conjugative DNA transfer family protein [Salmonella enterica subsp. enterica serovar Cerro]